MRINRKWTAVLAVLLVVNIAITAAILLRMRNVVADPLAQRAGFTYAQMHAPEIPSYDPNPPLPKPGFRDPGPGYGLTSRYEVAQAFAVWGGELRYWLANNGKTRLFIYGFSVEGDWSAPVCSTAGFYLNQTEERYAGMIHFPGPASAGSHSFTVKTGLMAENSGPGIMTGWHDYGYVGNDPKTVPFGPVGLAPKYTQKTNPAYYFDKANRLFSPKEPSVQSVANRILASYSGGYSVYHAAAAFDFVHDSIKYVREARGKDYWQSPQETLAKLTGDCEDFAFVAGALITAMNGTARFHMEKEHAFVSVYAGNDLISVQSALETFYNTPLRVAALQDRYGYWIMADPTDAMYLGGLPLGGQPLADGWDLTNTTFHYTVDLLPG